MSRVVPNKLTAYQPLPIQVSNKNLSVEYASIIPANAASNSKYAPSEVNRILFRVPAFQNSFLDNSRSSLSFTFKPDAKTTAPLDSAGNGNILNYRLGTTSIFKRLQIKSANGTVIEDLTDLHLLQKILQTMKPITETRHLEGLIENNTFAQNAITATNEATMLLKQLGGQKFQYFFDIGMLSRKLQAYLPLHSMNGGNQGHAFTIELWLNDSFNVLKKVGDGTGASVKGYSLTDVKYNMCLLKADASIISRFNNLANDNSEILIPFSTYKQYTNGLNAPLSTVQVSEACSDLRRVHSVILDTANETTPVATDYAKNMIFYGGYKSDTKLKSYQMQIGSHFIYTEPILSENDNNDMLFQLVNSSFSKQNIKATRTDSAGVPEYEKDAFTMSSTFCVEDPNQFTNGVSLSSLPLVMRIELTAQPSNRYLTTFSELGFNLSIQNGYLTVKDSKDPSDFGY